MLEKLFRVISGGQTHPKFTFTCTGINSDLIVVASLRTMPRVALIGLLSVPGVKVSHSHWLTWEISLTAHTMRVSRIHNQLLRLKKKGHDHD